MTRHPLKISIVIPAFNAGRFIGQTLESIRNQNDPSCEVIVMDGGSTDDTCRIVEQFPDVVTVLVSEKDGGQSDALNKGFARTTGDVLAWMCADDYYLPGAFRRVRDYFDGTADRHFLYGDGIGVDGAGNTIREIVSGPVLDYDNFANYNYVFSTTAFWSRWLWIESGGHVDTGNHWTMDWELFIRMSRKARLDYQPGMVAALRSHEDAKTAIGNSRFKAARDREIVRVSRKHGGWFCFNSRIYPAIWLANQAAHLDRIPMPFYRYAFALAYLPMRWVPSNRHSIFFNGKKPA